MKWSEVEWSEMKLNGMKWIMIKCVIRYEYDHHFLFLYILVTIHIISFTFKNPTWSLPLISQSINYLLNKISFSSSSSSSSSPPSLSPWVPLISYLWLSPSISVNHYLPFSLFFSSSLLFFSTSHFHLFFPSFPVSGVGMGFASAAIDATKGSIAKVQKDRLEVLKYTKVTESI